MRIVFMGTPEFAVPSLDILVSNRYEIAGVITATDKTGGRGNKKRIESAVKKYALSKNLKILQPANLKSPEFAEELRALKADLQVVVAFRMLPVIVWDMPPLGTINLHASLLPKYRGAAPINWAIINGEKETGLTTFFIRHEIDTGDVLFQKRMPIYENDTAGDVHDRMMKAGADLILKSVRAIESGNFQLQVQNERAVSKAPKIFHETCRINFNQPTSQVYNFIRGLSPYPAAWTFLDNQELKIYKCSKELTDHPFEPGKIVTDNKKFLKIATKDGFINVHELKLQGRRQMDTISFLNGYSLTETP